MYKRLRQGSPLWTSGQMPDFANMGAALAGAAGTQSAHPLVSYAFDPNPGTLGARKFVPPGLAANAPLVVVLHGCTQTPDGYDRGTAWTDLAERHGFAVVFPEQSRANNANGCFNWFEPRHMRRGEGEPASIKSMIDRAVSDHRLDPSRIYITGLSAGAAMAGVMLATYPETFAGAGLIAGLPYGVATSVPAALSRMRTRGRESDVQLADLVRSASTHDGPWPSISVWHGTADTTVHADNADATVAQWRGVHGLADADPEIDTQSGHPHRVWRDASGRTCVEEYVLIGMGHGTPLDAASPENAERAGAFLLDVGLSSTLCLAKAWGLITADASMTSNPAPPPKPAPPLPKPAPPPSTAAATGTTVWPDTSADVRQVIEQALKAAGLLR